MSIEISQEFEESENNSEWPKLLENFEDARDEYLLLITSIWKNPIFTGNLEDIEYAKESLLNAVRTVMHGAFYDTEFDNDDLEKKLQRVGSTGAMCDEDLAERMNKLVGEDKDIFATIRFVAADEVEEELSEHYASTLAEVVCAKIDSDYEKFFDLPRFRGVMLLKEIGGEAISIGKIASATALGFIVASKWLERKN